LPHQFCALIPSESGYAAPLDPIHPPSSHIATRLHSARSTGVTVSELGATGGVETVGAAVVVVLGAGKVVVGGEGGAVVVVVASRSTHDVSDGARLPAVGEWLDSTAWTAPVGQGS
jgi:hypothetical protein